METMLWRLEKTAGRMPSKTAFAGEREALTFEELFRQAHAVACALHARGCGRGTVAICMEKTPSYAAALFGVMGAGACYVPMEADAPPKRRAAICKTAAVSAMICDRGTAERIARESNTEKPEEAGYEVLLFDELAAEKTGLFGATLPREADDDAPAYIMFTSGSTGAPKGVVVTNANLEAYLSRLISVMGFSAETVFANQTPFSTDASLKELFPVVLSGATAHLIPPRCFSFPLQVVRFLNERRVNTVCWAAGAFAVCAALGVLETAVPATLRTVSFGSEVLPPKHLRAWMKACPEARFTNLYGPTEATGVCCYYHVPEPPADTEPVPAGVPFPDAEVLLAEKTGELIIGGPQVSAGYIGDRALTEERFFTAQDGKRFYRTGDAFRRGADGLLYYTGRLDLQVKRMGYRIEPAEIEACGMTHAGVSRCACVFQQEKELLLFYYEGDAGEAAVSAHLAQGLPRFLLPNRVVRTARLPLNANGKIDRMALLRG